MQTPLFFQIKPSDLLLGGLLALLSLSARGQFTQLQKLTPQAVERQSGSYFGLSVAVDGNVMVVGAYYEPGGGAAYVFERSGGTWNQTGKLTASDRADGDYFGYSVSVSGSTIVVGAYEEDEDASGGNTRSAAGSAYVFEKSGATWDQTQKLTASGRAAGDVFGIAVSVSGSTIVVGANGEDASDSNPLSNAGAAYVFEQSGGIWGQTQKLTASDRAVDDQFGRSVSVSDSTIVVGAFREDEDASGGNTLNAAGSAYVFEKSGATWNQTAKLTAADRAVADRFGYSVSVSGSTIVVGADLEDQDASGGNSRSAAGSAYVYEKSGTTWGQTQKLTASDRANEDQFGISVSVSGSTIVVGAFLEDQDASGINSRTDAGSAYVFEKSGTTWGQTQKLTASDRTTGDYFGASVSVSGSTVVVGAYLEDEDASGGNPITDAGSAYVFTCAPPSLSLSGVPLCAGRALSLTLSGGCSDSYAAQLSDAVGSFANPMPLGSVEAGANALTLPAGTPTGAGYRLRVLSGDLALDTTAAFSVTGLASNFNSTPTVSLTPACAGAVVKVSFTVKPNPTCSFPLGNVFSAELSDASGSFASPFSLGTVSPGINNVTVPENTPTGTGYRVRIAATAEGSPVYSSVSAVFSVNQPSFATVPTVSGGDKCAGQAVRLSFSTRCTFFSGNTFTAYLSDATGAFPGGGTFLGTVNPGAINDVVIPGVTAPGTPYKIRIVSSTPVVTSAASGTFKVKACGGTSREVAPEDQGLRVVVSPNPSPDGRLRISVSGAGGQALRVELFNGLGQSVREQRVPKAGEEEILDWNVSHQPQGLYLLRVNGEKESKSVKVLH